MLNSGIKGMKASDQANRISKALSADSALPMASVLCSDFSLLVGVRDATSTTAGVRFCLFFEWLPDGSGFLFSLQWVPMSICSDIFEYNFAAQSITQLTPTLPDESEDGGARGLSISPDGQQIVFERAIYPFDTSSSLWMMNRDGSNLHKLFNDAGRPAWGQIPTFPAPTIASLNPSSAIAGGSAFPLTVNGTNFVSGSVVRWNGSDRATIYVDDTQLTASITADDIAAAGSASIIVFNPAPGGGTSDTAAFSIIDPAVLTYKLHLPLLKR